MGWLGAPGDAPHTSHVVSFDGVGWEEFIVGKGCGVLFFLAR